jgi:4-hydroxy-2-oxoheptanedioate aldolase
MGSEHKEVATRGMAAYRAPSLFQPHKARQAIRDAYEGKINPLIGLYCGITSVSTARIMAQLGADAVWIDWEHSSCGVETMTTVSIPDVELRLL